MNIRASHTYIRVSQLAPSRSGRAVLLCQIYNKYYAFTKELCCSFINAVKDVCNCKKQSYFSLKMAHHVISYSAAPIGKNQNMRRGSSIRNNCVLIIPNVSTYHENKWTPNYLTHESISNRLTHVHAQTHTLTLVPTEPSTHVSQPSVYSSLYLCRQCCCIWTVWD